MDFSLILNKNGLNKEEFDNIKKEYYYQNIPFNEDIFKYWTHFVKIKGKVTLLNIVEILEKADKEVLLLLEKLSYSKFTNFFNEIKNEKIEVYNDIKSIEVSKYIELNKNSYSNNISIISSCSGVYKTPKSNDLGIDKYCSLIFSNWASLKNIPVKIKTGGKVIQINNDDYKEEKFNKIDFTLNDFFIGLFNELCFFGSPDNRDNKCSKLKKDIEELKKGTLKTIPYKEIKDKILIKGK